jgi:hypothetical protein
MIDNINDIVIIVVAIGVVFCCAGVLLTTTSTYTATMEENLFIYCTRFRANIGGSLGTTEICTITRVVWAVKQCETKGLILNNPSALLQECWYPGKGKRADGCEGGITRMREGMIQ